jgi:hypothetical protein
MFGLLGALIVVAAVLVAAAIRADVHGRRVRSARMAASVATTLLVVVWGLSWVLTY